MPAELLLFQLKGAHPPFVSKSYIGEVVARSEGRLTIMKAALIYESAGVDNRSNNIFMRSQFYTNTMITHGSLTFKEEDILWEREINVAQERDDFLTGYFKALDALRLEKLNIKTAARGDLNG